MKKPIFRKHRSIKHVTCGNKIQSWFVNS
jgi:hypothetical protein